MKLTEQVSALLFCLVLAKITFKIFELSCWPSRAVGPFKGAAAVYLVIGVGGIVLPLGLLAANLLSWAVPALRRANEKAFQDHKVSFTSANIGLIKCACASGAFGMVALYIAAIEPWAR